MLTLSSNHCRYVIAYLKLFAWLTLAGVSSYVFGIVAGLLILVIGIVIFSLSTVFKAYYYPGVIGKKLETECGFALAKKPYQSRWNDFHRCVNS